MHFSDERRRRDVVAVDVLRVAHHSGLVLCAQPCAWCTQRVSKLRATSPRQPGMRTGSAADITTQRAADASAPFLGYNYIRRSP